LRRTPGLLAALGLFLLGAAVRPPGLADVADVRVWEHDGYTRVVVELTRPAEYATHVLEEPPRLYLDIGEVWIGSQLADAQSLGETGPVQRIRGGQNTLRRARVVLEMDRVGRAHRTFHLSDPFRIVTDVYSERRAEERPRTAIQSFDSRPVRRVVLDPGHGGKDPGARSRAGLREKEVVLRIARAVRTRLQAEGLEALLTREDDRYLKLEERTEIANRLRADLFISIHANASRNRRSEGVETYLLDTRYDRQTARVAARENGTTVEALDDLHKILASLRLGYNERFAARLAQHIHDPLVDSLRRNHRGTRDLGVKRGPFLVLFSAEMPAVLVEVGFLSNRRESARMGAKAFVEAAADGITRGVLTYRDDHARRLLAGR
jgi:N-acetylmuramoyl-L-alanine amidase